MTKTKFYNNVAENISKVLGSGVIVDLQEVTKVNLTLDGLTIRKQGENIAPTIYLNQYFNQFNDGRAMDDIVSDIIRVYENNQPENIMDVFKTEDLSLDTKCKVLGIFEVGHGTVNACLLHTREIMIRNVLCGASAFIVAHNHPSGELSISRDDVSTTKKLYEAGELMGIHLLDHIIIGREDEQEAYYSMAEHGLLKE